MTRQTRTRRKKPSFLTEVANELASMTDEVATLLDVSWWDEDAEEDEENDTEEVQLVRRMERLRVRLVEQIGKEKAGAKAKKTRAKA